MGEGVYRYPSILTHSIFAYAKKVFFIFAFFVFPVLWFLSFPCPLGAITYDSLCSILVTALL